MVPKIKMYLILELMTAFIVGGWQYLQKGLDSAILVGLTILISFSPFCLALTSPLVLKLAEKLAAALGVKVNSREAFLNLSTIDTVAISMNNIITDGNYYVTDLIPEGLSQNSLLNFAASASRDSNHILAKKICETAEHRRLLIQPVAAFHEVPGCGVEALMNNTSVRFGRPKWIEKEKIEISAELLTKVDQLAAKGKTPLMLSMGRMARGIIALKDEINSNSKTFLNQLKQLDFETVLLSGESKKTVNAVSKNISIDSVRAALSPEGKAREIQIMRARGKNVAMIGKEFNDLPALISADVSLLLTDGSVDLKTIDINVDFEIDKLQKFIGLRKISERAKTIISQNRWLAYLSWILLLPPSIMMVLDSPPISFNPVYAAAGIVIFILLILANSMRMKTN